MGTKLQIDIRMAIVEFRQILSDQIETTMTQIADLDPEGWPARSYDVRKELGSVTRDECNRHLV